MPFATSGNIITTSNQIAPGIIVNSDVSASAAIAYSKLNLALGIVNADVSATAAIAYSKLDLALGIVNADVSASAAIVDTKLNTIATAGKVSGAALTLLANIPSGAGVIPAANLPSSNHFITSTCFEDIARFTTSVAGSGTIAVGVSGLDLSTSSTGGSFAKALWTVLGVNATIFSQSPKFSCSLNPGSIVQATNNGDLYVGLGNVTIAGTGITYTNAHIGFKIVKTAGATTLYATQADGTTETASSALTTFAGNADDVSLFLKVNGTTSVDYYWRKDANSAWATVNLTTNMPAASTVDANCTFGASNTSTATNFNWFVTNASYQVPI